MDPSKDHKNWVTVGELIRLIKEPVALYTSQIIEKWHVKLCSRLIPSGRCTNPAVCETKTNPGCLCLSCKGWYDELAKSHQNKNKRQIKWRENCDTSKWPVDPWEVAKFFMPILGDNKKNIKDAKSTDLSSLLNALAWMKNAAFAPDRRVDLNLVTQLRSEVRNPWAHAPDQELAEAILNDAFDITNKFVADLDKVFSFPQVKECIEDIKFLQANGLSNVKDTELKIVNLGLIELGGDVSKMKEEIKRLEEDQSSERQLIKELEKKLENLEKDLKSLQHSVNSQETDERSRVKSCIPEKPQTFIGRDTEVKQIISSLVENGCGIVSIVGGPGFGKSSLAIEVSHHLSNNHDIVVIFSYLSSASTVPEVMRYLCHDVGVYPGEDPESSLMLSVKNIEKKVVLVMDNIEQLLESNVKSEFTELLLTLRKNSHQQMQILTTTRTEFSVPGKATVNVQIGELDEKSSVELLRKCCPDEKVEDMYLSELTKLCGFVPLALCIAGTLIPDLDDPSELIQWLREKPMEALQNSDQCIPKAIELSFQKLEDEEKNALARLSVFDGNFQKKSAQEVIDRDRIKTQNVLRNLVTRSLIQKRNDKRFVIHSLIRRFLTDHDQFEDEKTMAQGLMVRHFLEMCHALTMDSYSCNGFTSARDSLKKDVHNVEETLLIICSHDQASNLNSNILQFLANSNIYKYSSRFFYDFGWDLLPQTLLRNFFECCIKLAESLNQPAIEITFQCLVADQEGHRYGWKSPEYTNRIESIREMFHANEVTLKEDRFLFCFCYYSYARYEADQTTADLHVPVNDLASLPVNKASSPIEKVAEALILRERGQLNKKRANKMYPIDEDKSEEYMNCAKLLYKKALLLAKELLGDHELTCTLYKQLGDLLFNWHKNEEALAYYCEAIRLRKELKLDSNEQFVFLLKNYGACLSFSNRSEESVEKLKEARDIAEKLTDKHTSCRAKVYSQLARVYYYWKLDCQEAAGYARTGMEMQGLLHPREITKLQDIIEWAAENVA